jgi:phosphate transport system permease protein
MTPVTREISGYAGADGDDRPNKGKNLTKQDAVESGGCVMAALATAWIAFTIAGLAIGFGLLFCWYLLFLVFYAVLLWRQHGILQMKDRLATVAVWTGAAIALVALASVILFVIVEGGPIVFRSFPHFLTLDTVGGKNFNTFGVGPAIVGTVEQVGIATAISIPLAYLTATYIVESQSALSRVVATVVDAMTGTPSIIAGIFIYLLLVQPAHIAGPNGFHGSLALSIMMLPVTCRAALEVIRIVPGSLREAGLALGAPQWRIVLQVVLPTARSGLITAGILGIARTAGETAEVLLTTGGTERYNWNPFSGAQDDLPLRIFEEVFTPSAHNVEVGWGAAFVLVTLVLALFTLARIVGSSNSRQRPRLLGRKRMKELV